MNGLTRLSLSLQRTLRTHFPGAKAGDSKWEVKTPLNFTAACYCGQFCNVTRSFGASEILVVVELAAYLYMRNSSWWAVWLGWHPAEKISAGPKGRLRWFRNPSQSVRAKAGFILITIILIGIWKQWPNEPRCAPQWGLELTEKLPRG